MNFAKEIVKSAWYMLPIEMRTKIRNPLLIKKIMLNHKNEERTYAERLEEQLMQLQYIVKYAYENTNYYHSLFDNHEIKISQLQNFDDFKKIPILTKDDVTNNLPDMISKSIPKNKLLYVTTGGSTGKPLGFYISKNVDIARLSFEWLHWNHMGYKLGDKCVFLRGRVLTDGWYAYEKSNNYLVLSTFKMTENLLPQYIKKIEDYGARFIQGYPSALTILAKYMLSVGKKLNIDISAISTSSELLYPEQKEIIEKAFNAKVYDKYGNSEQVGVIGMFSDGKYREFMEHSYLEYLNEDGNNAVNGCEAEIIGTSFINDVVPFIRYKTEDLVDISTDDVYNASSSFNARIIDSVKGRLGDAVITRAGGLISITALNTHSDIFDNTKRIQYFQDTKGVVVLKIVRQSNYSERDEEKIKEELFRKFQNQVELHIEYVDDIPKTARGKYKYLDQRLKM